jgi:ParB-like nuclease domain
VRPFTTDDAFPLSQIDLDNHYFMSRLNPERWEAQVQALMLDIEQHGQWAPVGLARFTGKRTYVVIYGFTRTEAIRRLGRTTIRANLYEELEERQARILNAGDNASHQQLTAWERAVQIQKLRESGVPVESQNGEPSIARIFGMSRRNVFNWLKVVEYRCAALHQAVENEWIGLQHALLFIQQPVEVTEAFLAPCIQGEWSSGELKVRLQSAPLHPDTEDAEQQLEEGATLHAPAALGSEQAPEGATLHTAEDREGIRQQLEKAGRRLLAVSGETLLRLSPEEQVRLKEALRMVLEVIAPLRQ